MDGIDAVTLAEFRAVLDAEPLVTAETYAEDFACMVAEHAPRPRPSVKEDERIVALDNAWRSDRRDSVVAVRDLGTRPSDLQVFAASTRLGGAARAERAAFIDEQEKIRMQPDPREAAYVERWEDLLHAADPDVERWEGLIASSLDRPGDADPDWPMLNVVDIGEVLLNGVPPTTMLVDGLLVDGDYHLWYGPKESGKTWVLAYAVSELLKRSQTVVWADKEMSRGRIAERLALFGVTPAMASGYLVYMELPTLDGSKESRSQWTRLLLDREPVLVACDAQTEFLGDAGLNSNHDTDVARWHTAYMEPARRAGATTLMLDHSGFDEDGRARGSGHKGAAAKVELSFETSGRFDHERTATLTIKLRKNTNAADVPETQRFRIGGTEDGFVFEPDLFGDADSPVSRWTDLVSRVEDAIVDAGEDGVGLNAINDRVKGTRTKIRDAAISLADDVDSEVQVRSGARGSTVYYSIGTTASVGSLRDTRTADAVTASGESTASRRGQKPTQSVFEWRIETKTDELGPAMVGRSFGSAQREWTLFAPDGSAHGVYPTKREAKAVLDSLHATKTSFDVLLPPHVPPSSSAASCLGDRNLALSIRTASIRNSGGYGGLVLGITHAPLTGR